MKFCESKIKYNTNEILSSSSFLDCDQNVLKRILQMDSLFCTEAELIEACMSWVKSVSNQEQLTREIVQKQLGDLFYEMPFGSMSLEEFAAFDRSYGGLFTLDEYREIIQIFASKDFQPELFRAKRKIFYGTHPTWNEAAVVVCDRTIQDTDDPQFIENVETTTFSTNKTILLGAIECARLYEFILNQWKATVKFPTKITITESEESTASGEGRIVYNGEADLDSLVLIRLPNPILIKPGFVYKIRMEQDPPPKYCMTWKLKSQVEIESGITVKFHSSIVGEVMKGLVRQLEFNRIET
ncbi:uncharacterized protein LOC129567229 [Sitodiplosis mosellana]|uniref:uncharacterized protein LOC129567229 n=1 Tax=Sitodiplosis mosellana TaxID=263140 RepID=UPI002444D844|nr:uncharacterized protein LOC129567229 [Sitodiplosis mosellana]XP_055299860.1 uncharacterized protein LOC129567229 [Sitodiplosis mosellana]